MFSKTNKPGKEPVVLNGNPAATKKAAPSVISSDMYIMGNIVCEGLVDIDGALEGNVKSEQVTVRSNGKIIGDVTAGIVHIYGIVHGLVRADRVMLYSSCHVEGIIMYQSLSIEDGAFVDGKCKRINKGGSSGDDGFLPEDDELEDNSSNDNGTLRLIG